MVYGGFPHIHIIGRPVFGQSFQINLAGCLSFALTYSKMTQEKKIVKKLVLGPPAAIFVIFDPFWNQRVPPVEKKFLKIYLC